MRDYLVAALGKAAEEVGYAFFSGNDMAVSGRINDFPAAWLCPIRLTSGNGVRERTTVFHVVLNLICGYPARGTLQEEVWHLQENDAGHICRSLGQEENIVRVFNFKCSPGLKPLTKHADTNLCVEFDVETFHCL